jgi:polar amino acid transport system substrate-binding protein
MRVSAWLTRLAVIALAAGCAADPTAAPRVDGVAAARAMVPADIRSGGRLTIGSELMFAPMEYKQDGKPAGFEIELSAAIADRLGLTLNVVEVEWAKLRENVMAGKIHAAVASMTDNAKRQKEVDYVDYLNVGSSIVVRKGTRGIRDLSDLCGRRVAVLPESIFQDLAESQARQCGAARPLTVVLDKEDEAAVLSGRADAYLDDFPLAVFAVEKYPNLQIVGEQIEASPYGIAVAKNRKALTRAIQLALYDMFQDGTYDALLKKWRLPEGSLKTGAINGGA